MQNSLVCVCMLCVRLCLYCVCSVCTVCMRVRMLRACMHMHACTSVCTPKHTDNKSWGHESPRYITRVHNIVLMYHNIYYSKHENKV